MKVRIIGPHPYPGGVKDVGRKDKGNLKIASREVENGSVWVNMRTRNALLWKISDEHNAFEWPNKSDWLVFEEKPGVYVQYKVRFCHIAGLIFTDIDGSICPRCNIPSKEE